MTGLPDAERDAGEVVRLLATLAARLRARDIDLGDEQELIALLAADGGAAATRVLAYLRDLQGSGDGVAAAVPPRLGPWREWVPPRGHLFGTAPAPAPRVEGFPRPRRRDPGE
ncbi:hypothetical protein Asp14428_59040 [Actinoplanes sp. NBRC 14428]|uniref:Uncharacterized protein n=1 Tax=Pseudosporangium ferrugineum TaxID=439699 RepID=A0A2T0SDD4_9ACTN|nr:hypothetical protein [Pseudosporangium ferrugineum]PRY31427.1 hypothetical protein CLV70_103314 [Pseudosporangium ferrugineum]BCJ54429.1 hypothetical protein Asp14428_59040 [Actinoplanes sp. NBRC 14428]